ncbi:MAG: tRNA (adenosine(37)-N6)-threonylcarbamoyltransferase complex ATPase subunit type 1 TsaE [Bacilli bacterium]|nr:tRNA (adenosine(37)-N6)-threonylcarbamoyltransferase complex ATPase subunit type 1 TsaE [Bacilli bacterium]MDD4077131.1 tRNA (adenosine(37)-N6)-threonylcarbamoyltransferase complex ATPase subunit type 1 TsaE [Bacilli bacterium]MDD4388793.1 tRNA (adenosine(37)-N6)-threonylcarbamoyltransferase complex ATPase subunit type 1 TsaE [Bacilli bacterium]
MEKTLSINSETAMISLGKKIGTLAVPDMVIALNGDLGAGKTTLTKGIGKGLGIKDIINSPTFTILKIYHGRLVLYHFDVYRLNAKSGDDYLEEYFYQGGLSVIEWAKNITYLLPKDYLTIEIKIVNSSSRKITFYADSHQYISFIERVLL